MTLKITAVLLSSVLASASYASEGGEVMAMETIQPTSRIVHALPKTIPDSFEGVGEYRARRAALESRLKSFEGQKLKVFTPEIFAEMLAEGVSIAELGIDIFGRLPAIAAKINQQLSELGTKIASKNATIPWRELLLLIQEVDMCRKPYWNEFKFDMDDIFRGVELQPQVVSAHVKALNHNEGWASIKRQMSELCLSLEVMYAYNEVCSGIFTLIKELFRDRFDEERDESITKAFEYFLVRLKDYGISLLNDFSPPRHKSDNSKTKLEEWLRNKMQGQVLDTFDNGIFRRHVLVFTRELVQSYVEDPTSLSPRYILQKNSPYFYSIQSTEEGLRYGCEVETKSDLAPDAMSHELSDKLKQKVHAALEETFEWLMTQ